MSIPRTLLLSSTRPGESSVGEVFLRDLCRQFPHDKLFCFAPIAPDYEVGIASPDLAWIPMQVCNLPKERVIPPGGNSLSAMIRSTRQMNKFKKECAPIIAAAVKYASEVQAQVIWAVLSGPAIVYITKEVVRRTGLPVIPLVWDPFEYILMNRGYNSSTKQILLDEFAAVLKISQSCGVASDGMKQSYELRFGIPCQALINSVPASYRQIRGGALQEEGRLIIGFAGSIYAKDEMQALLAALTLLGWELEGRAITLRILGNAMTLSAVAAGKKCRIEFLGFYPTKEAIEQLGKVDIAYLPYWFDEKYAEAVRLCFPNKFSTYQAAGCFTLYHGPKDSAPTRFLEKYPVGIACHSMDPEKIAAALKQFVGDGQMREQAALARINALEEELNQAVSLGRLAKLFQVEEEAFMQAREFLL